MCPYPTLTIEMEWVWFFLVCYRECVNDITPENEENTGHAKQGYRLPLYPYFMAYLLYLSKIPASILLYHWSVYITYLK